MLLYYLCLSIYLFLLLILLVPFQLLGGGFLSLVAENSDLIHYTVLAESYYQWKIDGYGDNRSDAINFGSIGDWTE